MYSKLCTAVALSVALTLPSIAAIYTPAGANYPWEARRSILYLRLLARSNNFTGAMYMVRGERILGQRAFGLSDIEHDYNNTPLTRFHVAGVSKVYTATAILLLEQDGKLHTADPASQYVAGETRTIDALLAGHADADYDLLAQIVEKVSGQPFSDFMKARIFAPLHLERTAVDTGNLGDPEHVAIGTEPVGLFNVQTLRYDQWRAHPGSQGIVATASDSCTFAQGIWRNGFLSPASTAKMKAGGYGWTARERAGHPALGADGHAPGFSASLDYFPDSDTCVVLLTNSDTYVAQAAMPDMDVIAFRLKPTYPDWGFSEPEPGALEAVTGAYRMPADFIVPNETVTLSVKNNYLEAKWSGGITTLIYPTSSGEFIDRNAWAQVHFTRDASGKATGFEYKVMRSFTAQRVQ